MIKALWNRFGFWLLVAAIVGTGFWLSTLLGRIPESPAVQMDMNKIILYERTLNTDVIFVEEDQGVDIVIAEWNEDWAESTVLQDFTEKYDPIMLVIYISKGAIVEADGKIHYGTVYTSIGKSYCMDGNCGYETDDGLLADPEAVDWDWGRR